MKKIIAFLASWTCYVLGDLVCRIMWLNDDNQAWAEFWYTPYNALMLKSLRIQDWAEGTGKYWVWGSKP